MQAKGTFFNGKRITFALIMAFILFNVGMGFHHFSQEDAAQLSTATVLPQPKPLTDFQLTGGNNKPFTNYDLDGHWTMMFFGFTHCASICPANLNVLNQIYKKLQTDKQQLPQVVFISIDPERDTAAGTQRYVMAFNPSFKGVVGTKAQIDAMAQELSVLYMKVKKPGATNASDYEIDHSGTFMLLDPTGKLFAVFSMPHDMNNIVKDYETITQKYSS